MFKNWILYKKFLSDIKYHRIALEDAEQQIQFMPVSVLRRLGKKIIYKEYDGYNSNSMASELFYFDNLDKWQKEIFVKRRLYVLYMPSRKTNT